MADKMTDCLADKRTEKENLMTVHMMGWLAN